MPELRQNSRNIKSYNKIGIQSDKIVVTKEEKKRMEAVLYALALKFLNAEDLMEEQDLVDQIIQLLQEHSEIDVSGICELFQKEKDV